MERNMSMDEFNKLMQSTQEETDLVQMLRQVREQARPEQIRFEGNAEFGGQAGWAGWTMV